MPNRIKYIRAPGIIPKTPIGEEPGDTLPVVSSNDNGKVLGVIDGNWDVVQPPDESVVKAIVTVDESSGTPTASMTSVQIKAIYDAGGTVVLRYKGAYLGSKCDYLLENVTGTDSPYASFYHIWANEHDSKSRVIIDNALINSSGTVQITNKYKINLPNPNSDGAAGKILISNGSDYYLENIPASVLYNTSQTLTDAQKSQARTNVGAGTYSKPSGGIPASDLASGVQTSLGKADTALQTAPVTSVNGMTGDVVITVDSALSSTSENPVQNKVIKARFDALATFTDSEAVVPLFTNVISESIDTDSTPYQNGAGYIDGYRMKSSTGVLEENTGSGVTGFIPLPADPSNMVLRFADMHLKASGTSTASSIQFYDSTFTRTHGGQTGQGTMVIAETDGGEYATRINFADQTSTAYIPRSDDAYFRISAYDLGADSIITINEEIAYDEHGEITSATLKSNVNIPQLAPLDARITALEEDEGGGTIDSTDPLVKYAEQIDNGLTVGYEPTLTGRPTADLVAKKYLNFLHISDTHGSVNAENAVKILNKLKADGRCSFLIHTGDFHSSTFADVASWNAFAGYIAQANAPVLLVSGNHDVGNNSQSTTNGQTATDAQLYARCFEPYVSGWNLTSHPTGKCYWYKDFADEGVRLIGLYDFESDYATDSNGQLLYKRGYAAYHQAQIDWLVQALLSCPAGYGVIIAKHNPMNLRGDLDNPFNGEFLRGQNTSQSFVSKDMIAEIVQAFMDGATINKTFAQTGNVTDTLTVNQDFSGKNSGAHFICYLDGHTHADGVNFLADFPNQLELNIGCDNYHYQHYADTLNQQGTLHQDLLNYVSVDVNRGYVYIQRIGNAYTAQVDRRDFTAIDYKNPPTAADDPSEAIEALDSRIAVFEDYPLVKEYTADSVQTGIFALTFDKPLKALRVFIEGVANSDVSAKQSVTLQIGTGSTSFNNAQKILYGQLVSNTVFTAFIDVRLDKAMKKWISDGAIGTVNAANGYLNARQLNVVDAATDVAAGRTNIFNLRIRNDSDQTNGVSVTTGTTIKVYGLEA